MSSLQTKRPTKTKKQLAHYQFGLFSSEDGSKAYLGIHYFHRGKLSKKPLILEAAHMLHAEKVMQSLINAGADIDPIRDIGELRQRLKREALIVGEFSTKLGWFGDYFLMPDENFGENPPPIAVQPVVRDLASKHFSHAGSFAAWYDGVAKLAEKSSYSYCMFIIMMAFAAVLLRKVFNGSDEGFTVNFAGDTSRGKTTALTAGKSVSGGPNNLISWGLSKRKFCEELAAASDTLLAIDGLDSIASRHDFGRYIADITHLISSGSAMTYSVSVQVQLPDLFWTSLAATGCKGTVENLSRDKGYSRSPSDRVRLFDIPVPDPSLGGIWDRMDDGDDGSELTMRMQKNVTSNHGTALPKWLDVCVGNPKLIQDAADLIQWYVNERQIKASAGMEQRIARKFGLICAAGVLAAENDIVPWGRDDVVSAVVDLHEAAMAIVYDEDAEIGTGLKKVFDLSFVDDHLDFEPGCLPSFTGAATAAYFTTARKGVEIFFIEKEAFEHAFVNKTIADEALKSLKNRAVLQGIKSGGTTMLERISINGKEQKKRYLRIDRERLREALKQFK